MPFVPEEMHCRPVIMAMLVYAGEIEVGEPIADLVKPMRYPEIYHPDDDDYHPVSSARTMFVEHVDLPAAEKIVEYLERSTAQMAVAQIRVLGGPMARVPANATAFAHRSSRLMVNVAAVYGHPHGAPKHDPWGATFAAALRQGDGGAYVNFLGDEGEALIRAAYPGTTWDRLTSIKDRYDPTNLFRLNQNVPPATGGRATGQQVTDYGREEADRAEAS